MLKRMLHWGELDRVSAAGRVQLRRVGWLGLAGWVAMSACAMGCKGAAARCGEAQANASSAWTTYEQAMSQDLALANERAKEIDARMRGDVDRRLTRAASQEADRLNRPGTAEWHRTYAAHLQAACTGDQECADLRVERRNLEAKVASLQARIAAATEAANAASREREEAKAAVAAVDDDFDYPQIKPARAASDEAYEACEGIAPEDLIAQ